MSFRRGAGRTASVCALLAFLPSCGAGRVSGLEPTGDGGANTGTVAADFCPCPETWDPARVVERTYGQHLTVRYEDPTWHRDELVLFLHGTGLDAASHKNIEQTAAFAGHPVVAVTWDTLPSADACIQQFPDTYDWCMDELRAARLFGAEYPGVVQVSDADSVVGLTWDTLVAAHAAEPDAGWDRFFDDAPDPAAVTDHERLLHWDRIVVAGFSQGAATAGFAGHVLPVDGVVMVSGPLDDMTSWELGPHVTPTCAWSGFVHDREQYADGIMGAFVRLGLGEEATDVAPVDRGACDQSPWPPYDDARSFVSFLPANEACSDPNPHSSMAIDACMNVAEAPAGDPYALFRPYLAAFCRASTTDPDGAGGCVVHPPG